MKNNLIVSTIFALLTFISQSQNTVGLTNLDAEHTDGYVLFSPMAATETYLINKCGEKVHEWNSSTYEPALSSFLLPNGELLRTGQLDNPNFVEGGSGGILERFDWNGNLEWNYSISDATNCLHHDICPLPNGNILCIVWDARTKAEAVFNGKDTTYSESYLWSEKIVELKPIGTDSAEIVWEWKVFDHLIQEYDNTKSNFGSVVDHPELIDINYFPGGGNLSDWIHINSVDYNSELDQILLSSHRFNEVWIVDHSTTTSEAASHVGGNSGQGGDLLFRWGNPQAYQRGNPTTKILFGQHHATWIPTGFPDSGKILIFNNGLGRPGTYSSIDLVDPVFVSTYNYDIPATGPIPPSAVHWSFVANTPSDFYSSNISGVYPTEEGSFVITSGASGEFFEIDSAEEIVWEYTNPVDNNGINSQGDIPANNQVFRCEFYEANYAGLQGQPLVSMGEIELNPTSPSICDLILNIEVASMTNEKVLLTPNPFSETLTLRAPAEGEYSLTILNSLGERVLSTTVVSMEEVNTNHLASGVYFFEVANENGQIQIGKLIKH